ncbi:MAG: hypothetical protein CFE21_01400 [Bacteroidetes bacterium B1(2017)]|nr:MAG: hypothetical protein CFE21_01400 [Bacteroidetes bacterium B1(2017)]
MKKYLSLYTLLLITLFAHADYIKINKNGNLSGLTLYSDRGTELKTLEAQYEELMIYTNVRIGGINLGERYFSSANWNDTEFVDTPIDPNDMSITRSDTIVNDTKNYIPGKLILAKKGGKWGIISIDGVEKHPFNLEAIYPINSKSLVNSKEIDAPHLAVMEQGKLAIMDQNGTKTATDSILPNYFKKCSKELLMDALEVSYFGDYLLINEGGILFDTVVKVPAIRKTVNGKLKVIAASYSYHQFWYRGGKFNVWQISTQTMLFPTSHKNIEIHLQDATGSDFFEPLNVRNYKSILKFQENNHLGLTPSKINFVVSD